MMDRIQPASPGQQKQPDTSQSAEQAQRARPAPPSARVSSSALPPLATAPVQKLDASGAGAPALRSASSWTADPWMDVAHRGVAPPSAPVQRKAAAGSPAVAERGLGSAWGWTMDAAMDAAHRGVAPVQRKGAPSTSAAASVSGAVEGARAPSGQRGAGIPTREEVHADPASYGIPPGGNPDDWFNEYIAHTVAYMNPEELDPGALDPEAPDYAERLAVIQQHHDTMRAWGYDPESLTFLSDSQSGDNETGLQAVRIDPLTGDPRAEQGEIGSIVGFRGTEPFAPGQSTLTNPTGALDDVAADLGQDIGGNQYRENQERIRALIAGGSGPMTLTGHSLGGALAQHAAAGNSDLGVANVVGFQAPGIDSASARSFDAANADGHIDVRFHEHGNDVVHRAGEQKLRGTHNTWNDTNDPWFGPAHTSHFMYDGIGGDGKPVSTVGAGSTATTTESDPITNRLGWEGGRRLVGGAANIMAAPTQGAFATLLGLGEGVVNAGQGLWDSGASLVGGITDGAQAAGGGISRGASQIGDGEVLAGLGTMASGVGQGIADVAGGVWDGATGLVGTAAGAVGDVAGAAWDGVSKFGSELGQGVGTVASGVGNLAQWGFDSVAGWFSSDEEPEQARAR